MPPAGYVINGIDGGVNGTFCTTGVADQGSRYWVTRDLDGDALPDLVMLAQRGTDNQYRTFGTGTDPVWKVHLSTGSGFTAAAVDWPLPAGGLVNNGDTLGFTMVQHGGLLTYTAGTNTWGLEDLNGDGRPDLVITGERPTNTGDYVGFVPGGNGHWRVHLNNGAGFDTSPVLWTTPPGGRRIGGVDVGFPNVVGIILPSFESGTDVWRLIDMNADGRADLVVSGEHVPQGINTFPRAFDAGGNSHWKVYTNTGTAFATTAVLYSLPAGGHVRNGAQNGFYAGNSFAQNADVGSDCWDVKDLNGDGRIDLLVMGSKVSTVDYSAFDQGGVRYWKVHWGGPSGFDAAPATWWLPAGGMRRNGLQLGFNLAGWSDAGGAYDMGSNTWTLQDMNADRKPDLLVMGERIYNAIPYVAGFGATGARFWKPHAATDTGFTSVHEPWSIPDGGVASGGIVSGFTSPLAEPGTMTDVGSEAYELMDLDGSGSPDLVVTSARTSGTHITFGQSTAPHWRVYLNPFFVGVAESATDQVAWRLFPNPATDEVRCSLARGRVTELMLYDVHGRSLRRVWGDRMDLAGIDAGLYLLVATDARGAQYASRLIKQ